MYSWSAAAKASVFASPDPSITTLFEYPRPSAALVQANYSELQPSTYRTLSIARITPRRAELHPSRGVRGRDPPRAVECLQSHIRRATGRRAAGRATPADGC